MTTIQHVQTCVTELRIALNQLNEADSIHELTERYQNVASIFDTIKFDIDVLAEEKAESLGE